MAITATNLATSGSTTDSTSFTTGSISPSANKLILLWVYTINSSAPNTPTVTGNSLNWVNVASRADGANIRRITLFRAMGTPTSGPLTIDFAGQLQSGCAWSIVQYDGTSLIGTDGSGALVQAVSNASIGIDTSLTVTLAAFSGVGNATVGGFGVSFNSAGLPAVGSGFTATGQFNQTSPNLSIASEFNAGNDTTVDMNVGASTTNWLGIAAELAIPAASVKYITYRPPFMS